MPILDPVCRFYQSLFRRGHPEQARLVELHSTGQTGEFLQHYFDHEYRKGEAVLEGFAKMTPGWPRGRTLDFGCGAGGLTYRIAQACDEAIGLDLEPYKLEFARAQSERLGIGNARFVHYDGQKLPFADDSFDCVVCVDVIEHLPTPAHFVAEFARVLIPGGRLLLSFGPPWYHAHGKHIWTNLPGWWTHLIFPRSVVMRMIHQPPETTWEQLGLHRLSVAGFHRAMASSGLEQRHLDERINRVARPLKAVPKLRELLIGEVVSVYQKPQADASTRNAH